MNVLDLLDELGIEYKRPGEHHHATNRFLAQIDCPWCDTIGHFHLGVNETFCSCWHCGSHSLYETLLEITGKPVSQLRDIEKQETKPQQHVGKLKLPQGIVDLMPAHRQYLLRRKFDPDEITKLWKVKGLAHNAGIKRKEKWQSLAWRLYIPIHYEGQVVSWTSRAIGTANSGFNRYSTALQSESKLPRTKLLYGLDFVRWTVVVCEGAIDVWALGPGAVATLGTGYSQEQAALLVQFPVRYILFDNEPEAQNRARQLCDYLSAFGGQTYNLCLTDAKDPASLPKREIKKLKEMIGL